MSLVCLLAPVSTPSRYITRSMPVYKHTRSTTNKIEHVFLLVLFCSIFYSPSAGRVSFLSPARSSTISFYFFFEKMMRAFLVFILQWRNVELNWCERDRLTDRNTTNRSCTAPNQLDCHVFEWQIGHWLFVAIYKHLTVSRMNSLDFDLVLTWYTLYPCVKTNHLNRIPILFYFFFV